MSENAIKTRKRPSASGCASCKMQPVATSSPLDANDQAKRRPACGSGSAGCKSHFSAALDQHYPQVVRFSLCEFAPAFAAEISDGDEASSGESDDEDALRSARG